MTKLLREKNQGFSLMEIIVSLFVIVVLMLGVYSLIILSLQVTQENNNYVEATAIANQKMEQIRNLPYRDVGVVGGIPSGILPQTETIFREGTFTVYTYVTYYDDSFDGQVGSTTPDSIPNDYKIATVKVRWQSKTGLKDVTVFTKIIPRTVETFEGYGLLKIYVGNASAQPVANANVRVVNNNVIPVIDVTNPTNASGVLYLPATSSNQSYEIYVSKTDQEFAGVYYSTDQSYDPSTSKSPYHLSVTAGNMTEESFAIDKLAHLRVRSVTANLPENWRANQANADNQTKARVSLDGADRLYYAWPSASSTHSYVYVQKFDSSGNKQWANDYKISTTQFQVNPDIATDAAGNSFVVWQDNSFVLKQITLKEQGSRLAAGDMIKIAKIEPLKSAGISYAIPMNLFDYMPRPDSTFNSTMRSLGGYDTELIWPGTIPDALSRFIAGSARLVNDSFKINLAQAAGSIVQTKIGSPQNGINTLTATFDSPPSAGNVIIAMAIHRNDNSTFNAPTNAAGTFTQSAYSNTGWYLDVGIWHKITGASEPSQVSITNSGNIEGGVLMIMEVSGLDTTNLLGVTVVNDQTGGSSNTATTGNTAVSGASGFAVAAIGWADNNFDTPTSGSWSSGSSDSWTHRLWSDWWTGNNGSLAVATLNITAAAAQRATLTTTGGGGEERNSALAVFNIAVPNNITVSATSTQISSTTIPTVNFYTGGKFIFTDNTGAHTVIGITITEDGTVNAANGLNNIKLYYDLDISAPYDCDSESFSGSEPQFGSTDIDGFSSANGTSSFSGSVNISTTTAMCAHVVIDVETTAGKDTTVNLKINNPSTDVTVNSGSVLPATAVEPAGSTNLNKPAEMQQIHYRWRNDDDTEADATWKAYEDSVTTVTSNQTIRLRLAVTNGGSLPTSPVLYRLEYGENMSTCDAIASWVALPTDISLDWRVIGSTYINDGDPTTNISGLSDENTNFKPGEIKDADGQTAAITLNADEFTEIEYAIEATNNASANPYCFRLTNAGATVNFNYLAFPEATVIGDDNIYLVSLDTGGSERFAVKRVNQDIGGESQANPSIALTENFGTATTVVAWEDGRNGDTDIYLQIFDSSGNKILGNDLRVTSSSTAEHSPRIVFDSNDNFFVAWVENAAESRIYLQKYALSDLAAWPESVSIVTSVYDLYSPAIGVDSADNLYLAYTEEITAIKNVYLAKYDNNGGFLWEAQANVEDLSGDQLSPGLAVAASYVYVAWTDTRENNDDIYAQKFNLSGTSQWGEDLRLNINVGTSTQNQPVLAVTSVNEPFAAWSDNRGGNYDIYATAFSDPGTIFGEPNVPIRVWGTKTVSETPQIYKFDGNYLSDANGYVDLDLVWDALGYNLELIDASTSLSIILEDPLGPLPISPDETKTWLIYVE